MAHCHAHSCKHDKVEFCKDCRKVYCLNCKTEWAEPCTQPHYWYTTQYPVIYGNTTTTGYADFGDVTTGTATSCSTHGE